MYLLILRELNLIIYLYSHGYFCQFVLFTATRSSNDILLFKSYNIIAKPDLLSYTLIWIDSVDPHDCNAQSPVKIFKEMANI